MYYGESGLSGYQRGKNHIDSKRLMHDDSILWRHEIESHNNTEADFKMFNESK